MSFRLIGLFSLVFYFFSVPLSATTRRAHHRHVHKGPQYDLTVVGPTLLNDGIGKQAVDLVQTLSDSMYISFIPVGERLSKESLLTLPLSTQVALRRSGIKHKGRILVLESPLGCYTDNEKPPRKNFWLKYGLKEKDPTQIRIAYSMYESSLIPQGWVKILNHSFDAVAVPDPFLVDVYKNSGVLIPIFVVPLGRDLSPFLSLPLKTERHSKFIFANFSLCDRRKNTLKLVEAFAREFSNDPTVKLRLCWRTALDKSYRTLILDTIQKKHLTNVIVEERSVDISEHIKRFLEIDCLVSASTGEGFSIIPREAMALGIPSIVTNNTAQTTICDSGLVRSVPANIPVPAMYPWKGNFGFQYDCTVDDLAAAMREVYENYNQYILKAPMCREWARSFDLSQLKSAYMNFLKPKKVVMGPTNAITSDGIMTTSPKLFKKFRSIFRKKNH